MANSIWQLKNKTIIQMKALKTFALALFVFGLASHAQETVRYISTAYALKNHEKVLKNKPFLVFPETRERPLKWFDSIPEGRIEQAIKQKSFEMLASPGEFFVFQLGFWTIRSDANNLQIHISDFKGVQGNAISAGRITCFNTGRYRFQRKTAGQADQCISRPGTILMVWDRPEGYQRRKLSGQYNFNGQREKAVCSIITEGGGSVREKSGV
jgi:hypothetical protein